MTQNNLSEAAKRGCGRRLLKTASSCRRARFSNRRSRRERKNWVAITERSLIKRSMRQFLHGGRPNWTCSHLTDSMEDHYFGEPQRKSELPSWLPDQWKRLQEARQPS